MGQGTRQDMYELAILWLQQAMKLREAGSTEAADLLVQCATELQDKLRLF